ncbi:MAG: hypothetical protein ACHQ51_05450 [Elusimicrobiota bacterium]
MRVFFQTTGLTFAVYSTVGLAFGNIARLGKIGAVFFSAVAVLTAAGLLVRAFRNGRPAVGPVLAGIVAGILATGLVWNTFGLLALNRAAAAAREVGMTTDHAPVDPRDAGNAAPLYLAMNDTPSMRDDRLRSTETKILTDFLDKAQAGTLKSADEPPAASVITRHDEALALARRAEDLPRADWAIDWEHDPSWERPTPLHFGAVMTGRLLAVRAVLESRHGHGKEALETVRQGLLMARSFSREPLLIGPLCAMLIDIDLLRAANAVSARVSPADARARWDDLLDPAPHEEGFWIALRQELFTDPMHFSRLRWWDVAFGKYRGERRDFFAIMPYYWPFIKLDLAAAIRSNVPFYLAIRDSIPLHRDDYVKVVDASFQRRWLIGLYAIPDYSHIREKALIHTAYLREARVGLAAAQYRRQHGRWPGAIEDLTVLSANDAKDPFSTANLVLAHVGQALTVSSVAPDARSWTVKP